MSRQLITRGTAATGFVALAIIATACGGSSKTATVATTTTTVAAGGGGAGRQAAFRQCMLTHGVTLPANARIGGGGRPAAGDTTGTTGPAPTTTIPAGVTAQQWQGAITACNSQLPRPNLQNNPQVQLYYNCLQTYLSTHGATTLPPLGQGGSRGFLGAGNGGPGSTVAGSTTTTNPTLQSAQAHCATLRPTFGGGTTTTSIP